MEETGRIDGWWVYFKRTSSAGDLPYVLGCNPVQYKSIEGAHVAFEKYNPVIDQGGTLLAENLGIGDESLSYHMLDEYYYTGVFVRYRNYIISIWGLNKEGDYPSPEPLIEVANSILSRLQEAPLVPGPLDTTGK